MTKTETKNELSSASGEDITEMTITKTVYSNVQSGHIHTMETDKSNDSMARDGPLMRILHFLRGRVNRRNGSFLRSMCKADSADGESDEVDGSAVRNIPTNQDWK